VIQPLKRSLCVERSISTITMTERAMQKETNMSNTGSHDHAFLKRRQPRQCGPLCGPSQGSSVNRSGFHLLLLLLACITPASARPFDRRQEVEIDPQIIGGSAVNLGEFPYFTTVDPTSTIMCGSTIIAEDMLITAAACDNGAFDAGAVVGAVTREGLIADGFQVTVVEKFPHPDFSFATLNNDIMLFRICPPIPEGLTKFSILNSDMNLPAANSDLSMMGFGRTGA
jgi:hypothetical protein